MTLIERIDECNRYQVGTFSSLHCGNTDVGWVHDELQDTLVQAGAVQPTGPRRLALAGESYSARSAAADAVSRVLEAAPLGLQPRGERCTVFRGWLEEPLADVDRALLLPLGLWGYGVHMSCYVQRPGKLSLWVAKRAASVRQFPGMLDTSVGGCLPARANIRDWLAKEAAEEAGLPPALVANAVSVGVTACAAVRGLGLSRSVQLNFDLELDETIALEPIDGEVESFELLDADDVAERIATTSSFKPNSALVIIDFLIRRGVVSHDHPHFVELVRGLRRGLDAGRQP